TDRLVVQIYSELSYVGKVGEHIKQAVAVKMPISAHVITQEFDAQLEAIKQRAMSQQVDTKSAGLEKAIENNQALGGEVKAVKATDTNEPNSALTESVSVSRGFAQSMAAGLSWAPI